MSTLCDQSLRVMPRILLRHVISNTFSCCSEEHFIVQISDLESTSSRQVFHILVILLLLLCLLLTKPFLVSGIQHSLTLSLDIWNSSLLWTEVSFQTNKVDCLFEVLILYCNVKIFVSPSHVLYLSLLNAYFHTEVFTYFYHPIYLDLQFIWRMRR